MAITNASIFSFFVGPPILGGRGAPTDYDVWLAACETQRARLVELIVQAGE